MKDGEFNKILDRRSKSSLTDGLPVVGCQHEVLYQRKKEAW
jgi:hypothetical protein